MRLNLPILEQLADSKNILIAGAGGGHDILVALPLYFALREAGKTVHLASFTSCDFRIAELVTKTEPLLADLVMGALGPVRLPINYFPEGYLAQWFQEVQGEAVTIWMLAHSGVAPLTQAYAKLTEHLSIDALILVDGGVDSTMRGDESGPGTLIEDTISLAAVDPLNIPVKILACLGFGTEVEEQVSHHHFLENAAALAKEGAFLGACALTAQMEAFQKYEAAAHYVCDPPDRAKSHIHTRVIPAVRGEFGNYHMYPDDNRVLILISPLMSLYWFFDVRAVIQRSLFLEQIRITNTMREVIQIFKFVRSVYPVRPRRTIPY